MEKVIRDGKVAVIYAPSFGAGWYTWNEEYTWKDEDKFKSLMYHPDIVKKIEEDKQSEITEEWIRELLGIDPEKHICILAVGDLEIEWIPINTNFHIHEYDGSERLMTFKTLTETA